MVYALRYTGTARCCLCIPGQVSNFQRVLSNYSTTTTTHIAVFVIFGEVPGDRCKVFFIVRTLSRLSKTFVSGLVRRRCMYRSRTRCDIPRCLVEYSKTVFDVTAILYWNDIYIYIYTLGYPSIKPGWLGHLSISFRVPYPVMLAIRGYIRAFGKKRAPPTVQNLRGLGGVHNMSRV